MICCQVVSGLAAAWAQRGAAEAGQRGTLKEVRFWDNLIGDDGIGALLAPEARWALSAVTHLNLDNNGVGDEGMCVLAGAVTAGALQACKGLSLACNYLISDRGVSALAGAFGDSATVLP